MVKKLEKITPQNKTSTPLKDSVKDSAQQIWLAGLGAFNKAQAEGSKVFEALVKEGASLQRKTQSVAEGKLSDASSKMSTMATDISSKASGQWDKLENIFEDRVAKALNKLGVPSAQDVNALIARIDELNKSVQKLSTKASAPKAAAKTVPAKAAKAATPSVAKPIVKAIPKAAVKRAAPARKAATVETVKAAKGQA